MRTGRGGNPTTAAGRQAHRLSQSKGARPHTQPLAGGLLAGAGLVDGPPPLRRRHGAALLDLERRDVRGRVLVLVALALLGLGLLGHHDAWLLGLGLGLGLEVVRAGSCLHGACR